MKARLLVILGMLAVSCDREPPPPPGTPSTASADEVPFVVFRETTLVIDGIGVTARVPAAVGSTVTAGTIASSDPGIVEVTADGGLRARAPGRATIRAVGNPAQQLEVEVREQATLAPGSGMPPAMPGSQMSLQGQLSLRPSSAALQVGQLVLFEALVGGQRTQAQWRVEGPALVKQSAPGGFVAVRAGKTKVCASVAQQSLCAVIVVDR